ncbi:hypothetical protein [Chroococcidiopsis cubana]|uniref:hypothetical protein n=1 Tax=Chroococcidiopsis cubana TaxID=171392 RepID=UPI0015E6CEE9|nr:hypothetical protein [Chroococcidiopsis cubana]
MSHKLLRRLSYIALAELLSNAIASPTTLLVFNFNPQQSYYFNCDDFFTTTNSLRLIHALNSKRRGISRLLLC